MAGVVHGFRPTHDYGVDGQFDPVVFRGSRRIVSGHPLAFQVKATINWELVEGNIVYDLEAKTYDDIVGRSDSEITMILVLLCLPKDQSEWHEATLSKTTIRHCCYWHMLRGEPCGNSSSKRIYIPAKNLLTPDSLKTLLAAEKERRETQWS